MVAFNSTPLLLSPAYQSILSRLRSAKANRVLIQSVRRYATEAGGAGGSNALLYAAGAAAVGGAGYWYFGKSGAPVSSAAQDVKQAVGVEPKKAFTGGDQGFLSLKLSDVEIVNHNVKRLRFELPEADQVSGLHVASALLTKYKGPNDEKATLRPYTPISDESM